MQEEVNEKTISLCIKGGKITAQILKAALIKLLAEMDKKKQQRKGEKGQCKKIGKQSMPQKVSYVVTDPKGTIIIECGKMLSDAGYKIKVLNTINFKKSMRYNPFHYIRSEKDILKLVNTIIANTKGDGEKSGEDFWVKAERLLYCALIGYIWYEAPEEEQNFSTLLEFINASEAREDDEEFKNPVDELFEELEKKKPEHFAVRQYKKYKLAAGVVWKSSCRSLQRHTV